MHLSCKTGETGGNLFSFFANTYWTLHSFAHTKWKIIALCILWLYQKVGSCLKKMVKTWMLVKRKFSISLQSKAWSFFITHEHTFVHQSAGEPEIEMIQLQHWCDWLRYSPFYSATSIFAVFRNLVQEIWFEKSGFWLTRTKGGFIL